MKKRNKRSFHSNLRSEKDFEVHEELVAEGLEISQAELDSLIEVEVEGKDSDKCKHTLRIGCLCAYCGEIIEDGKEELVTSEHFTDELLQPISVAHQQHLNSAKAIHSNKKMILILDLDHTLIHSTSVGLQQSNTKISCDFNFTIESTVFYIKLRPYTKSFLKHASKHFQLHVYTMGTRDYASRIIERLDPTGKYFKERVVTRTENLHSLLKNIQRITSFDKNVMIIDDRLDVWNFIKNCLIIKPFYFYGNISICQHLQMRGSKGDGVSSIFLTDMTDTKDTLVKKTKEMHPVGKDKELRRIYKHLKKIHTEYFCRSPAFKNAMDVTAVMDSNIMREYKFICEFSIAKYIFYMGGKAFSEETDDDPDRQLLVIENSKKAARYFTVNLSLMWILKCLYKRSLVSYNKYIIEDYRK